MTRKELEAYIAEQYGVNGDFPWENDTVNEVFRHGSNRKWFALIMLVKKTHLGLPGDGEAAAVNMKLPPLIIGSMLGEKGFLPAYHMNKQHWITAILEDGADGEAAENETLTAALDMSFAITAPKRRGTRRIGKNDTANNNMKGAAVTADTK